MRYFIVCGKKQYLKQHSHFFGLCLFSIHKYLKKYETGHRWVFFICFKKASYFMLKYAISISLTFPETTKSFKNSSKYMYTLFLAYLLLYLDTCYNKTICISNIILLNSRSKDYNSRYVQNKSIKFLFFLCAQIPSGYASKAPTFFKAYHLLMLMCVHV